MPAPRFKTVVGGLAYRWGLRDFRAMWESRGKAPTEAEATGLDYSPERRLALNELLVRNFAIGPGHDVLDVGCGRASFLSRALATTGPTRVVGVDFASAMLQGARPHVPRAIEMACSQATTLPFRAAAFDRVMMHSVMHYMRSKKNAWAVVAEAQRVLKPGGAVYLGDLPPDEGRLASRLSHGLHFDADEIRRAAARMGMRMEASSQAEVHASKRFDVILWDERASRPSG